MRGEWGHFRYREEGLVGSVDFGRSTGLDGSAEQLFKELAELARELSGRPAGVRVLLLSGSGRGFCSEGDAEVALGRLAGAEPADPYRLAEVTGACVRALRSLPQPVVAAVNGLAAGPGAVIALAADLRVLAESAGFQFLFPRAGIAGADTGVCWLLPRMIGLGRASELLLLGERIDSEQALEYGLANRVVPDRDLEGEVAAYAERLLAADADALATTKRLLGGDALAGPRLGGWTRSLLMSRADFRDYSAGFRGHRRPARPARRA